MQLFKNWKKQIILRYIAIFFIIVIFALLSYFDGWQAGFGLIEPTKINSCSVSLSKEHNHIVLNPGKLLLDTGSGSTIFFDKPSVKEGLIGYGFIIEPLANKYKVVPWYFSKKFQQDSLLIENFYFLVLNQNKTSEFVKNLNISGILGMDVINTTNWLIDFDEGQIEATNLFNENEQPVMTLFFSFLKEAPKISVIIDDSIKIENILFDTGSDSYLKLLAEDIQRINKIHNPVKEYVISSAGLYSDSIPENTFLYCQMKINEFSADSVIISQSSLRLMGIQFLKQFNRVFFDSHNKKIDFYKDNKRNDATI